MENIQSSSLKSKSEVIADLKEILQLVNDGKEGYQSAAEGTKDAELKAIFIQISGERMVDETELKEHLAKHDADNDHGGILGGLHRTWLTVKQTFSSNDDKAILSGITTGERAALEKYDECIVDPAHADHAALLTEQRDSIKAALTEIEKQLVKHQ